MKVGFGTKSHTGLRLRWSFHVLFCHTHRPAGNVKGFFDKFDGLMEAETFFLAHKSYIDADNVLRQIVCLSPLKNARTCFSPFMVFAHLAFSVSL